MKFELTIKFLNFRTPENFAVIYLKLKQRVANSEDPDQTLEEQSDLGLHCLPRSICPKT